MPISIFNYSDYKEYLRAVRNAKPALRGLISRLARFAGCQPSFLSQAIHGSVHLTPDQAYGVTQGLQMSEAESEYFLTLVDMARASSAPLREKLARRAQELIRQNEDITKRIKRDEFDVNEQTAFFFTTWLWSALQTLVSIPAFRRPAALAIKLSLSEEATLRALQQMEAAGFVAKIEGEWRPTEQTIHLSKRNPHVVFHHQNWRQRAVLDAQNHAANSIHFTGVYALSKQDAKLMREKMMKLIEEFNLIAAPSSTETGVCMLCDLFSI